MIYLILLCLQDYLLSLDLILDLGYLDLHGVDLLVLDQRNRGGLAVLDGLEGQVSQRDVPLAIILLTFPVRGQGACRYLRIYRWNAAGGTPTHPAACFFSLAQSSRSVNRKTWRSFLDPSTSSTMKRSLSSWRFCRQTGRRAASVKVVRAQNRHSGRAWPRCDAASTTTTAGCASAAPHQFNAGARNIKTGRFLALYFKREKQN